MPRNIFEKYKNQTQTLSDHKKKKKLQQLLQSARPLLLVSHIFGAAPLTFNLQRRILSIDTQPLAPGHRLLQLSHWLWCLILAVCVLTATHYQRVLFDGSLPFITRTIYSIEYPTSAASFLLAVFGCQLKRHLYADVVERLADLDVSLEMLGVRTDYRRIYRGLWGVLGFYTILFTCIFVVDFEYNAGVWKDFLRSSTTYCLPNITWVLALTQFGLVMVLIKDKLAKINFILELFKTEEDLKKPKHPVLRNIISRLEKDQRLLSPRGAATQKLRHMYLEAMAIAKLVTKSYSLLLCLSILAGFFVTVIQFFQQYRFSENLDEYNIYLHLYSILWLFLFGGRIIMILYAGQVVSQEKAKTGPILLHELESNGNNDSSKADPYLQSVIHKFSMQIMHEETHMTAVGILKLNLSLINPILHALTTYLVILIQFDAAAENVGKVPMNRIISSSSSSNDNFTYVRH